MFFLDHLKEKLNFNVDDLCKIPVDDLRWQVDYAISQVNYLVEQNVLVKKVLIEKNNLYA